MAKSREVVEHLFGLAGITVNGDKTYDLQVHNEQLYRRLITDAALGLGEAYMEVVDRCLKDDGIAFIHTIGGNISTTMTNPWTDKYIFPNAMLPSIAQIARAMECLFMLEDWHNFGPDYDKTLLAWCGNFEKAWPQLKEKYDERFHRMWKFYLLSSAGAFRSRSNQLWQIVMTKTGRTQPDCRSRRHSCRNWSGSG